MAGVRGLTLHYVPSRVWVESDLALLARVVRNFLSNAVRYTEHGHLLLGCRRRADGLEIMVGDTGPGIPEPQRKAIFLEFRRASQPQANHSRGLGLGLAIVDRISTMLDHPVTLASRLGHGSLFSILVPYAASCGALEGGSRPVPSAQWGDDTLQGGIGDDTLRGGEGNDIIVGGADNDTVTYDDASAGVDVDLANYSATGGAGNDSIYHVENVVGSDHDDTIAGDAKSNILDGGAGDDTLSGGDGADTFVFEDGTDTDLVTDFDLNADAISLPDLGISTWTDLQPLLSDGPDGAVITLPSGGTVTLSGVAVGDLTPDHFTGIDNVGTPGEDTLGGGDGDDSVDGGGGNDSVDGGDGKAVSFHGFYDKFKGRDFAFVAGTAMADQN